MVIHDAIIQNFVYAILIRLEVDHGVLCWVMRLIRLQAEGVRGLGSEMAPRAPVRLDLLRSIETVDLKELDELSLRLTEIQT